MFICSLFVLFAAACAPAQLQTPSQTTVRITASNLQTPLPSLTAVLTIEPTNTNLPLATLPPLPTSTEEARISDEALAYLQAALDLMQANSINRYRIHWEQLRSRVIALAGTAQTPTDTYRAIQFALNSLEDNHSYLVPAEQAMLLLQDRLDAENIPPSGETIGSSVVYISMPGIAGSVQVSEAYAINLHRLVAEMDSPLVCGWVIDLRENRGGNLWAMLAGIGPVLGEGMAGSFLDPDGNEQFWYYAASQAMLDDTVQVNIFNHILYQLANAMPLTAVLIGPETRSSGEAIAVAFRGRDNARSFGQGTSGQTTALETYTLSDGAWLMLAFSVYVDRLGNVYDGPILPDEFVPPDAPGDNPALTAAINWLLNQPECSQR